jgi:hypothetical protein
MKARMRDRGASLDRLTRALLEGDAEAAEEQLQLFVDNVLSYHDAGTPGPENLNHGFILGLLAVMEPEYQVRSNRESGRGRPDVMIRPAQPGKPGVLLELKVARPGRKTLEQALAEGLAQMQGQGYAAELAAAGAAPIHALAVAFDGKEVRVRARTPRRPREPRGGDHSARRSSMSRAAAGQRSFECSGLILKMTSLPAPSGRANSMVASGPALTQRSSPVS